MGQHVTVHSESGSGERSAGAQSSFLQLFNTGLQRMDDLPIVIGGFPSQLSQSGNSSQVSLGIVYQVDSRSCKLTASTLTISKQGRYTWLTSLLLKKKKDS